MYTKKKLSIVIPVYKSQECIEALVDSVEDNLAGMDYELIMVNDCSPDKSWDKIKKAGESRKWLKGVNLRKNSGQDNAIMAGFSKVSGDFVVVMDDDLQHDPGDIKKLIQKLEHTATDICFANFKIKYQKLWKNLGSWFNGKMAEIMIDKPPHIYLSPFKVIRKEIVDEIIEYMGPFPYVDGILFSITQNVSQVEVEHHERYKGTSNYNLARSIGVWLKLMTSFSVFPLRIATYLGILSSILGFILAIYYLVEYFMIHTTVEGWTSLVIITLVLSGIILLALGAIGEYVGRSYIQLYRKPQYSIRELMNT